MDSFYNIKWKYGKILYITIVIFIVTLLPFFVYFLGIANDYPNHIARVFIQGEMSATSDLSKFYELEFGLIPDLAMDLFVSPFVGWFGIYLPAQLFSIVAVSLLPIGAMLIHCQLYGRWSLWPLLSVLTIYSSNLTWGLINCIAAVGLAVIAFSVWIQHSNRPTWRLATAFLIINCALLLAHAFGLLVVGFLVLTWEIGKLLKLPATEWLNYGRARWYFVLSFGLPLVLLLWTSRKAGALAEVSLPESWAYLGHILLAGWNFGQGLEGAIIGGILIAIVIVVLHARALSFHPKMRVTLLSFTLLVAVMPPSLFGITYLHIRLPPVLLCLFFAATTFETDERECKVVVMLLAIAALVASQSAAWRTMSSNHFVQNELIGAFKQVDRGARVLSGWNKEHVNSNLTFAHGVSFAVIESAAFVPNLFTATSIVKVRPEYRQMHRHGAPPLTPSQLSAALGRTVELSKNRERGNADYYYGWERTFDYFLWLKSSDQQEPQFPFLKETSRGSRFILYKIRHP